MSATPQKGCKKGERHPKQHETNHHIVQHVRARTDFFTYVKKCRGRVTPNRKGSAQNVSPRMKRWNVMLPIILFFAQPLTYITTRALPWWKMFALKERIWGLVSRQIQGWHLIIILHAGPTQFSNVSHSIGRITAAIIWQIRNSPTPHPTENLKSAEVYRRQRAQNIVFCWSGYLNTFK